MKMHMILASLRPAVDFHGLHLPLTAAFSFSLVAALSRGPFASSKDPLASSGVFTRDYF